MGSIEISKNYILERKKYIVVGICMLISLVCVVIFSVMIGSMKLDVSTVVKVICGKLLRSEVILEGIKPNIIAVVWDIRFPRIISGVVVGAGLAVSGVIFQSILQNPLADPYTMGVSTGAAFGASLAIFFNIMYNVFIPISLSAIGFSIITLFFVILIAQRGGGNSVSNLIIAGIIVSSILSSGISFIKMLTGESVSAIIFWIMGSFSSSNWNDVYLVLPVVLIGILIASYFAEDLNIMAMGDRNAQSLGLNAKRTRLIFLITGASITATCVSICGIIGFIGLIIPHILRFRFTSDNKVLIPLSALFGANLLCIADNMTRIFSKGEIPVGVLTTLLGGPFFIYIFMKKRKGGF